MQTGRAASWLYSFHRAFALFLVLFPVCQAVLVNRTIDNFYGDPLTGFIPQYRSPVETWADQTCTGCYIQPDPELAFNGTWMAATYHPELRNVNFTLEFTGIAIYVFFILSNANPHGLIATTNTQCNFTLDGRNAGSFSHEPDMTTLDMEYNATVFSKTGLTNTSHKLIVLVNDYPYPTFINFDWAIYTVDLIEPPSTNTDSSSTSMQSPSTSTGPSAAHSAVPLPLGAGIVVGCVLVAVTVTTLAGFRVCRSRRSPRQLHKRMTPGGILDIDNFLGESPRVESDHRSPSDSDDHYSASTSRAVIDYGRLEPNRGSVVEIPAMRQMETNERFRSLKIQGSRGKVRYMRQMETSKRFQVSSAQQEMDPELTAAQGAQPAPARPHQGIESLRNQVQEMIEHLQDQWQSDKALPGLPDEQPPAYE